MTREEVERAIREGVRFLKSQQRNDGSWADVENDARTGVTSMVTLALLTAGEKPESKAVRDALEYLRGFSPGDLRSTYAISLQTMVFAAADPAKDLVRITANVDWLQEAQIKPGDPQVWPGSWSYSESKRGRPGDNSNTQYALLGLHAASEVGVPVKQTVWDLSRNYWEHAQKRDGSWAYTPEFEYSDGKHVLCGNLEPDHLGAQAIRGWGISSGRDDKGLWLGRRQQAPPARHRLAREPLSSGPELRCRQSMEVLLSLRARARGPARGHPVLRPA